MAWWPRRARRSVSRAEIPVTAAVPAAYPAPRTWAEPALPPAPEPPPAPAAGVRLGFADGTEVELDGSHPSTVALRAVADLLVQDPAVRADNPCKSVEASEGS